MEVIIVGISGYKGSGKDSVADILVADYGFTKMAFADPLKRMLRKLDPIIGHELYAGCCNECSDIPEVTEVRFSDAAQFGFDDQSLKHSPWADEVRSLWERFGTDVFREEDNYYWVRKAEEALDESASDRIVFTDVRFENEADWIYGRSQRWGDLTSVWRVARPGVTAGDHVAEIQSRLKARETLQPSFCWHCRKPLQARTSKCPFCGEKQ